MTVLVTGATGNVGRCVVDRLLAASVRVRALTRRPETAGLPDGVELFTGGLGDAETLAKALDGVDRVHLFPVPESTATFVDQAAAAGVQRVVVLSSMAVGFGGENAIGQRHRLVEEAIAEGGFEWTFLRPGAFATNTLAWAESIRAGEAVREPFPESQQTPIHEDDIAAVAVAALLDDVHVGKSYVLTGPERISTADQVRAIGAAIGSEVRLEEEPLDEARARLVAKGVPASVADTLLDLRGADQALDEPVPTVEQVTGSPARTFAQWAVDHADDFR